MVEPIRVLIADDHGLVRKGLSALINAKPGIQVIGEAEDGEEAIQKTRELAPDVILLDLKMPHKDGVEAIHEIKAENPDAKILVLTSFVEDHLVFSAIKAGALGYLLKDSTPTELIQAIQAVYRGESSLSPTIALKLVQELSRPSDLPPTDEPLTPREVEVLRLVAKGLTNQEIGEKLVISERTVGAHVSTILAKLQLANRTQAALYALREGLVTLDTGQKEKE
jgi:NarL family two-component system response regulator LiaR